jgi:proline iminopeptidase
VATFVTSDGVQLYYERQGRGRRVFACAGGPASDYRYLAQDLAPLTDEFEFVYHDYRGSGRSESAPPTSYTLERLVEDLDELREHLGDDKVIALGHSMGGYVAVSYALRFPERCERLVLVGTWPTAGPHKMLPPTFGALGWARTAKMAARAIWWTVAFSWRRPSTERRRRLYEIWSTMQEGRGPIRAREIERERQLGFPLHNDNIRPLQREFPSWDVTDRLSTIACPVLVIYGERDAAAVAGARAFRDHITDVEVQALPDIGHDPFFEAPIASSQCLRSFLA